jgi:hypothetical protein
MNDTTIQVLWEEQQRWQHPMSEGEAGWVVYERRPLDGAICRWCGRALLGLGRCLVALGDGVRAAEAAAGTAAPRPEAGTVHG